MEQIHCIGASLVANSMNNAQNRRSNATLDHTSQVTLSLRQRCLSLATYCCVPYIVHDASREKQLAGPTHANPSTSCGGPDNHHLQCGLSGLTMCLAIIHVTETLSNSQLSSHTTFGKTEAHAAHVPCPPGASAGTPLGGSNLRGLTIIWVFLIQCDLLGLIYNNL